MDRVDFKRDAARGKLHSFSIFFFFIVIILLLSPAPSHIATIEAEGFLFSCKFLLSQY